MLVLIGGTSKVNYAGVCALWNHIHRPTDTTSAAAAVGGGGCCRGRMATALSTRLSVSRFPLVLREVHNVKIRVHKQDVLRLEICVDKIKAVDECDALDHTECEISYMVQAEPSVSILLEEIVQAHAVKREHDANMFLVSKGADVLDTVVDSIGVSLPNVLEDVNLDLCSIRVLADGSHNLDCNTCLPASVPAFEHLGKRALTHEFENLESIRDVISKSEYDVALLIVGTAISTMTVPPISHSSPAVIVILRRTSTRRIPCAASAVIPT